MKIKNTKLFRARARWHAKEGHVQQGTYGSGRTNGKSEFQGCFVGCLSTPHTKRGLKAFLREHLEKFDPFWHDKGGIISLDSKIIDRQHTLLTQEFGLTPPLISVIEAFFEAQPTHSEAIDLLPKVAEALNEGADIKPRDVERYWATAFPASVNKPKGATITRGSNYHDLMADIRGTRELWRARDNRPRNIRVRENTQKFLAWLSDQEAVA